MRVLVMAVAGLIAAGPEAAGEEAPGRFALQPGADGGFVRLDTRTGAASHCGLSDGVWRCEPFAEEAAALDARLARLEAEVMALRAAVAALTARLETPATPAAEAPATDGPPTAALSERLMEPLFALVRAIKGGAGE